MWIKQMKPKDDRPLQKHTIFLFEDAMNKLKMYHGRIGASRVVRILVDKHIKRVEEKLNARGGPMGTSSSGYNSVDDM